MNPVESLIRKLSINQKKIIKKAFEVDSTILFNIKGMIQVLHKDEPFDFIEMGYEDIERLKKMGLIEKIERKAIGVLHGEEYALSPLGTEIAKKL